jgi:hypothetical protein
MISSTPILRRRWADFGVDFVNEDGSGHRMKSWQEATPARGRDTE